MTIAASFLASPNEGYGGTSANEFVPQQFDSACGNGNHDCTAAITRCIGAAYANGKLYSVCNLPPGEYLKSRTLMFCALSRAYQAVEPPLSLHQNSKGRFALDFNCPHGSQNQIENITIDLRPLGPNGHVTAFGSSSAGGGGGNALGNFKTITVLSASIDTFAVSAASKQAEPGMFTGSTWINLHVSAPCNLNIGNNQDDGTISGSRLEITGPCSHSGSGLSVATNWKLIDTYVAVTSSNGAAPVTCGTNTDLDGLFIEAVGITSTSDPWLIQYDSGALGPCEVSRLNTNIVMTGGGPDQAMIRVDVPSGPNYSQGFVLGNYAVTSGGLPTPVLFSIFNKSTDPIASL